MYKYIYIYIMQSSKSGIEFLNECLLDIKKADGYRLDVNGEKIGELSFNDWNLYELSDECTKVESIYGKFRVIEKKFKNSNCESKDKKFNKHNCETDNKCIWNQGCFYKDGSAAAKYNELPNLVIMAGFSVNSFCGTSKVIMSNLDVLEKKYKAIYIICYDEKKFKGIQDTAFVSIDSRSEELKSKRDVETRAEVYKEEVVMFEQFGNILDKVIRCLGLTNVHLLGKSSGGGLTMNIVYKNPIYTRLYLAVPAHPTFCKSIEKLGDRLNKMKLIIGWNQNDDQKLGRIPSCEQMELYEPILAKLKSIYPKFEYKQYRFTPGNKHEINPELLKLIIDDK